LYDESKDGTWEILKECVRKYGGAIKIFRNERNI
jgi:hypothetical protein